MLKLAIYMLDLSGKKKKKQPLKCVQKGVPVMIWKNNVS